MINMVINMNRQEGKNQVQLLKGKMKWAITHHLKRAAQFHRPQNGQMVLQCVVKLVVRCVNACGIKEAGEVHASCG
jgi:hypothetical protein